MASIIRQSLLSGEGTTLWAMRSDGILNSVAVDGANAVVAAGWFSSSSASFGGVALTNVVNTGSRHTISDAVLWKVSGLLLTCVNVACVSSQSIYILCRFDIYFVDLLTVFLPVPPLMITLCGPLSPPSFSRTHTAHVVMFLLTQVHNNNGTGTAPAPTEPATPESGSPPGRAVQVDPIKLKLKAPGTKRLKLKRDKLLSTSAVNFKLRRYTQRTGTSLRSR